MSPHFDRPLRVGILVDSLLQPAWVHRVLADIRDAPFAELALVVTNGAYHEPSLLENVRAYRHQLLPLLYDRLDAHLVRSRRRPDAFARSSIQPLLAGVPTIEVRTIQKRLSDYFPDEDVEQILRHDFDVALRFGFRILRGKALAIARYGVWSYHHGDNATIRGGPNSFWEVMEARPVTGSILQVLTPDLDNGRVLYRSYSATNPRSLSLNRNSHYWKSAAFVGRVLRELHERGPAALDDPASAAYRPYDDRIYRRPGNLEALPILARFGARLVGQTLAEKLGHEQWLLAFQLSPPRDSPPAFHRFKLLVPPAGQSWSEPFPLVVDGRHYLLLTEHPPNGSPSRIVAAELDQRGLVAGPWTALAEADDLSYPFVFQHQGEIYLLPSRRGRTNLVLYHAVCFPDRWEPAAVVLRDVRAANPTLHEQDGRWWLFVNLAEPGASTTDELHLFWAASPHGPWQPHRQNPVRSDARAARPAGRLFTWHGRLYRPAQDCTGRDPAAIVINRIDAFDEARYAETTVARVRPRWMPGLAATGVLNHSDEVVCIDALARRPTR